MCNKTYGPNTRKAKETARERSNGVCQFCGQRPAEEGHHWLAVYRSVSPPRGSAKT